MARRPTVGPGRMKESEFGFLALEDREENYSQINTEPLWKFL